MLHYMNYALQEIISTQRRLQFLFLAIIYWLYVLYIIHSLLSNYIAIYQYSDKILEACEAALIPNILNLLKHVLYYYNLLKLRGHITV